MLSEISGTQLPDAPWGEVVLDIVLDYYDGPRLLLRRNRSEQLFLAWWSDSHESIERWIYLPVSESRLRQILSGEIPSFDALHDPEDGFVYVIDTDIHTEANVQTIMTVASALPRDAMPLLGARLNIPVPAEVSDAPTTGENGHFSAGGEGGVRDGSSMAQDTPVQNSPTNILHATTDPALLTRLKQMLGSATRADIAVGYFFVSGFSAVADELARLGKIRILVGRTDRETLEAIALGLQQQQALQARLDADATIRRSHWQAVTQNAVDNIVAGVSALSQTDDSQQSVARLRDLITAGFLEVRAYPRGLLHAKAYLCWYDSHAEPGAAIVGSSNFTLAGFTGNTELNVRVTGDAEMAELSRWFDDLWADSEDISEALTAELNRSWALAQIPPYHVYLKALYELYGSGVSDDPELPLSTGPVQLANFQLDAVRWGLSTIDRYGGCYIGDVVGLGKTYIGAELLRQLMQSYNREGNPLIICPARLVPMWEQVNETYQLGAEVVSQNVVAPPPDAEFDEELGRYVDPSLNGAGVVLAERYPNRGPVLVDEAHNFRNINRRSEGLRHYLESDDHKVILLSATPQNLGPRDIYRQLRFFLDETEHGLNIEPLGLEDYFRSAERWHRYRMEHEDYRKDLLQWQKSPQHSPRPSEPSRPTTPLASVEQVLTPVFIRRRRKDLRELYGDTATIDGQPVQFPTPVLNNLEYRLDRVYEKAGPFEDLQRLLKRFKAARYRANEYLKPEAHGKREYQDLLRAKGRIAGLMRALLLKRLESSIEAFRSTLNVLIGSNRNFKEALEARYVPIGNTATRILAGSEFDAEELLEVLVQEEERRQQPQARSNLLHSTDDFDVTPWFDDLDADHDTLSEIERRIRNIGSDDDDKLHTLRLFLDKPEVKRGKVLIFSESETTIDYLYGELNSNGKNPSMAKLSGSNSDRAVNIVQRFSPKSNMVSNGRRPTDEIRVLFATDVVSEGQNLQDCARVLNYDLHWNPVRMIQRFGRIDRIGTEHSEIYLHNMWPDLEVDEDISLTDRLGNRIQMFHDLIGLDSQLLSDNERLNNADMYRIYDSKEMPDQDDGLDEVAASQRAQSLLQRIQGDDPDLWKTITGLPDGIRSALSVQASPIDRVDERYAQAPLMTHGAQLPMSASEAVDLSPFDEPRLGETLVLLEAGGVNGCYAVGSNLQPRVITPAQLISAAECLPDTPSAELPPDTNQRVTAAFGAFQQEVSRRLGSARRPSDTRNRRYLSRHLSIAAEQAIEEGSESQSIVTLRRIFLGDLPAQVESYLTEIRRLQLSGPALLIRLQALRERFRLTVPENIEQTTLTPQVIRIVCSDGLTD